MRGNVALDRILTRWLVEETVYITADLQEHKRLTGRRGARVIPNGMAPLDRETLRRPGPADEFHVGIVGRLVPVKGHAVLLEAAARLAHRPGLRIDIFGTGPLEEELKSRAAALGDKVVFHGFRQDMRAAMASLDCVAMPSFNEGLPYTLLEAMHLGLPIVASRVGGMKEILSDGKTALLVEPGDAAALADSLSAVMDDRALGESLGAEARADARARFDIGTMAASYVKLYREVME
jgi:glycosyltransferase involved in cell wall biosynthesis